MRNQWKNILIGIFVVSAVLIAVFLILFLEPKIGDGKKTLHVRFANISGISDATRVTFAGRPVGEVVSIKEVKDAREQCTDARGRVYFYMLTLKIDSSVDVYTTDIVTVRTIGLMGEKTVAIIPKPIPRGTIAKKVGDETIFAVSTDPLEKALHDLSTLATTANDAIKEIDGWFVQNKENLTMAVSSFSGTMEELEQILGDVNQKELVISIKNAVDALSEDLHLIQQVLCEMDQEGTIKKFNELLDGANEAITTFNMDGKQILRNVSSIMQDVADGTGTLGKLITSDDLYLRVVSVMSKVNTLMNDLNHYGLLFQYNKTWQRQRTKKATLLTALDTPKEFRNYFENEIDGITTSLSRLFMLMEKVDQSDDKEQIVASEAFKKDFSKLIREVEGLSKTLKLYNEELTNDLDLSLPCKDSN
jgi:phospholipid/cholesterol/gamma-HCH transport system substrate-binding protein